MTVAWLIPSQFLPLLKHACREATSHHAGHQEVGRCSTRGGSQGIYITFASTKENLEVTSLEIQNSGTSVPKIGHVYVSPKTYLKKRTLETATEEQQFETEVNNCTSIGDEYHNLYCC